MPGLVTHRFVHHWSSLPGVRSASLFASRISWGSERALSAFLKSPALILNKVLIQRSESSYSATPAPAPAQMAELSCSAVDKWLRPLTSAAVRVNRGCGRTSSLSRASGDNTGRPLASSCGALVKPCEFCNFSSLARTPSRRMRAPRRLPTPLTGSSSYAKDSSKRARATAAGVEWCGGCVSA